MYGNGFLSRGFTDQREILHGGSAATSGTGFLPFGGGSGSARDGRIMALTGGIWRDMLLAEALVFFTLIFISYVCFASFVDVTLSKTFNQRNYWKMYNGLFVTPTVVRRVCSGVRMENCHPKNGLWLVGLYRIR